MHTSLWWSVSPRWRLGQRRSNFWEWQMSSLYWSWLSVCSGWYNKIQPTRWLIKDRNVFSREIWKPEMRGSAQVDEGPLPGPDMVGRARELYGSLYKDAGLIHEGSPSQGPYFLMPSPQRLGFQHKNWEGGTNIQLIAEVVFSQMHTCIKN